jgi:hypothetical protein
MVDRSELGRINQLYAENHDILLALAGFDAGGVVVAMTVSNTPSGNITVFTGYMTYPPQMIAGIREQMQQRRTTIRSELAGLGITGDLDTLPQPPQSPPWPPEEGEPEPEAAPAAAVTTPAAVGRAAPPPPPAGRPPIRPPGARPPLRR